MTTTRRLRLPTPQATALASGMAGLQRELGLPSEFPPEVEQAAIAAAANPRLPDEDRTDIEFVTIDPPDAMDLDQAMFVERNGDGYRVHYAIADVAAFVTAGDAIDLETHRRGETLYGADAKIPLHPKALSEDAASLLPDQVRPALLWTIELDASGEGIAVDVRRARIRSRAKLDYAGVQREIDGGKAGPMWAVLREIGELRKQREQRRGGVSLPLPEQEIRIEDGQWTLEFRARHPVEDWNEQISLLTGMAAAHLMVEHGVGLLRTLPEADPRDLARLHRTAHRAGHRLAAIAQLSGFHPFAGSRQSARRGDDDRLHHGAARRRLRRLRRRRAGTLAAFRARRAIHPRHRAVAAAGRSLHRRNLRGVVRRQAGAAMGAGRRCRDCRRRCRNPRAAPAATRTRSSTWPKRRRWRRGWARFSKVRSSRSTGRIRNKAR